MEITQLREVANKTANVYLKREKLGADEELQLMSCTYTNLFLVTTEWQEGQSLNTLAEAHRLIAESYTKIGQPELSARHGRLAEAYRKPQP